MKTPRIVAALLILTGSAFAQTDPHPAFEVASIKPSSPDSRGTTVRPIAGGIRITNMTLKELILWSYRIQPFQLSGGPPWLDSIHYDVTAKSETTPKMTDFPVMLQALMADRFQLTLHRDTKQLPVYALVLARKDGKLGPSLTEPKEGSCTAFDPTKPPPRLEPGQPPPRGCGMMRMSPRLLNAASLPVSQLTPMLSRLLGRTVIDKTGLTGKYDISLEWTPDESLAMQLPPEAPKPTPSDSAPPGIFTAIQEQLGLKLESQKGPVEVFIIDRAEKPSEN